MQAAEGSPVLLPPPLLLAVRPRLAPDAPPLARILITQDEHIARDDAGAIVSAQLTIRYRRLADAPSQPPYPTHRFLACYARQWDGGGRTSLTSHDPYRGTVFLDLEGLEGNRIGSFLMNQVVTWARRWPDAEVNPITLLAHQARGENTIRRNRFYEQFGIAFAYTDDTKAAGTAMEMRAGQLKPWEHMPDNLSVTPLEAAFDEQQRELAVLRLDQQTIQLRERALRRELQRAIAHPLRFAARQIWYRYAPLLVGAASLTVLGALSLLVLTR
ncbi:hypothetical protein HLH36_18830 [Gluconacetobacter aggeris]|uniref:Uncharacterized protein n=1 Tax=Gluconacetobacter aggeris TaxID=1286186 RepID=A0A7W4IWJ8_9PROT|nr:hypothetical protein [Gluconacetobacter aggeris]MBB2170371.1 hypothetical protein [Gluconacetobacter aggeris]